MSAGAAFFACAAASRENSSSNWCGSHAPSRIQRAIMRSIIPYSRSELDVLADRFDARRGAERIFASAGRARHADAAEERPARLDHEPAAHRRDFGPVANAALRPARLRGLGDAAVSVRKLAAV